MIARAALTLSALLAAGCDSQSARRPDASLQRLPLGVVASVDGVPVTLAEVERAAAADGLTPAAALARLEAEVLLMAESERRGYGQSASVAQLAEQARVQALLTRDIERETPTAAEIDAAYATSGERFRQPERRVATHVLAVLPQRPSAEQERAAHAFALEAVAKLRAAPDPAAALAELASARSSAFEIKVEALPPAARSGAFVPEFSEAMFSLATLGVVPRPVRTQFGWHAILVREILPARSQPESVARAELRRELELAKRQRRLQALLRALGARVPVRYAAGTRDALAALEL